MHTSIAKPGHVFNPSIVIGLNRVEAAASVQINFCKASACGTANGKVERRRRDAGTQPERNDRRRAAGGSTRNIRCCADAARDERAFCETEPVWS